MPLAQAYPFQPMPLTHEEESLEVSVCSSDFTPRFIPYVHYELLASCHTWKFIAEGCGLSNLSIANFKHQPVTSSEE